MRKALTSLAAAALVLTGCSAAGPEPAETTTETTTAPTTPTTTAASSPSPSPSTTPSPSVAPPTETADQEGNWTYGEREENGNKIEFATISSTDGSVALEIAYAEIGGRMVHFVWPDRPRSDFDDNWGSTGNDPLLISFDDAAPTEWVISLPQTEHLLISIFDTREFAVAVSEAETMTLSIELQGAETQFDFEVAGLDLTKVPRYP